MQMKQSYSPKQQVQSMVGVPSKPLKNASSRNNTVNKKAERMHQRLNIYILLQDIFSIIKYIVEFVKKPRNRLLSNVIRHAEQELSKLQSKYQRKLQNRVSSQVGGGNDSTTSTSPQSIVNHTSSQTQHSQIQRIDVGRKQSFNTLFRFLWKLLSIFVILLLVFLKGWDTLQEFSAFHPYSRMTGTPRFENVAKQLRTELDKKNASKVEENLIQYFSTEQKNIMLAVAPQLDVYVQEGRTSLVNALQMISRILEIENKDISINESVELQFFDLVEKLKRMPNHFSLAFDGNVFPDVKELIGSYMDLLIMQNPIIMQNSNNLESTHRIPRNKGDRARKILQMSKKGNARHVRTFFFDPLDYHVAPSKGDKKKSTRIIPKRIKLLPNLARKIEENLFETKKIDIDADFLDSMNKYVTQLSHSEYKILRGYTSSMFSLLNNYMRAKHRKEYDLDGLFDDLLLYIMDRTLINETIEIVKRTNAADIVHIKNSSAYKDIVELKKTYQQESDRDQYVIDLTTNTLRVHFSAIRSEIKGAILDLLIKKFASIIKKAPKTTKPMYVFRGVSIDTDTLQTDDIISDPSFMSTSADLNTANTFSLATIFRILLPEKSSILFVEGISKFRGEAEFILPPNSKFVVGEINNVIDSDGARLIRVIDLFHIPSV